MIYVSSFYSIVTDESAADGDFAETGEVFIEQAYSFRELVRLMREHNAEASCWPARGDVGEWYCTEMEPDYRTGEHRQQTIHYSRNNAARSAKYWRLAAIAAGIVC